MKGVNADELEFLRECTDMSAETEECTEDEQIIADRMVQRGLVDCVPLPHVGEFIDQYVTNATGKIIISIYETWSL